MDADIPMMDESSPDESVPPQQQQQRFNIVDVLGAVNADAGSRRSSVDSLPISGDDYHSKCSELFEADECLVLVRLHRLYPHVDPKRYQLPRNWSNTDKHQSLKTSHDLLGVSYKGKGIDNKDAGSVRADHPIPKTTAVYYFEIKITNKGVKGFVGIGLSEKGMNLNRLPGWDAISYGYHGDDGNFFASSGKGVEYGPRFTADDIVGCGINFVSREIFFTKNGKNLGIAAQNVPITNDLYPTIGMQSLNESVDANFGQRPFAYDVSRDMREARQNTLDSINAIELPQEKAIWMNKMISSWLAHEGYSRALEAFNHAIGVTPGGGEAVVPSLHNASRAPVSLPSDPGSANSTRRSVVKSVKEAIQEEMDNRRQLIRLVQQGRIKDVVEKVEQWYPNLLETNKQLALLLKTQQFIEMLLAVSKDSFASPASSTSIRVPSPARPSTSSQTFAATAARGKRSVDGSSRSGAKRRSGAGEDTEQHRQSPRRIHRASASSSRVPNPSGNHHVPSPYPDEGLAEMQDSHPTNGASKLATNGCGTINVGTPPTSTTIIEEFEVPDHFDDGDATMEDARNYQSAVKNGNSYKEEKCLEKGFERYMPLIEFGQAISQFAARHLYDSSSSALRRRMNDAFSLICTSNPFASDNAYLLEQSQRDIIARALNSAILEICGKESASPLDKQFRNARFLRDKAMNQGAAVSAIFADAQLLATGSYARSSPSPILHQL